MNLSLQSGFKSTAWNRLKSLSLVLGLLSLTACQSVPAQMQTGHFAPLPRTLSVSGKGEVSIPATIAKVNLGVEVQGKTAAQVQPEVAKRSEAVVKLLKERKVEKLKTAGINLSPTYSFQNNEQRLNGYAGSNIVSFEIATDKVGTLLDDAIKAGATRIDGISFTATEEAIAAAQKLALGEATEDAKKQADAVFTTLSFKSQEIVGIQINAANTPMPPMPMPVGVPLAQEAKNSVTQVVGGEQQVQSFVTLQIRY
ncbi:SIMPL domain-containing protein [Microcoleus sp. FACHB-68]|uniref:SIMPL domain-containing protein n=1 Tax=Microcoleus sp. FACHB-68 TaxID=2692826 RepID=UPI001688C283|nr:SIMPL domain-containing protein [Microcoleus sp. FACHB-68]MBD1940250.1 SIMPL domain-containing protein [Microcoleus sp. FACHB-68]